MKDEKIILGVCLWLGKRFKLNPSAVRIAFAILFLLGLKNSYLAISSLVFYLILYLLIPKTQN